TIQPFGLEPKTMKVAFRLESEAPSGFGLKMEAMSPEDTAKEKAAIIGAVNARGSGKRPTPAASDPKAPEPEPRGGSKSLRPAGAAPGPWAGSYFDQGRQAVIQKDWKTAEADFREAIRLQPFHPAYPYCLSAALYAQDRLPEAEAACRDAIALDPKDPRF